MIHLMPFLNCPNTIDQIISFTALVQAVYTAIFLSTFHFVHLSIYPKTSLSTENT